MKKSDIFWQTYLNIEKEILNLSKYIFFTDEMLVTNKNGTIISQSCTQLETFSPYIADLLVKCCIEIETISKELYFDNGGTKQRGDSSILFDIDCLALINMKWKTDDKCVMVSSSQFSLTKSSNNILRPLKKAYKKGGTVWEKAYQAVKHDRYSSLYKGTVKALLHAAAALYLLNIYYRNDSWKTTLQKLSNFDYSMGSSIFSVNPPVGNDLLNNNNTPIQSESPYVVRYTSTAYENIKKRQLEEFEIEKHRFFSQPELEDKEFIDKLSEFISNGVVTNMNATFITLGKYRINKKIPNSLSFEDRKRLLLNSEEWNSKQHQANKHLLPDKITEDNIQNEIDSAGASMGIILCTRLQKSAWIDIAVSHEVCTVYIPQQGSQVG